MKISNFIWTKIKESKINVIRNEREDIITENVETQRLTQGYYEQLYMNKLDNLEKVSEFLVVCTKTYS